MAIESSLIVPWKMVIFHCYVKLPEGKLNLDQTEHMVPEKQTRF